MSLHFSDLNSVHSNTSLLDQNLNNHLEEYYPPNPNSMQEILNAYNNEINKMMIEMNNTDKDREIDETINKSELDFLCNVISIKKKIINKKNKYKHLCEKSEHLGKEMDLLNDMINSYETFSNLYASILNKKSDAVVFDNIFEKINSKNLEKQTLENEITNTMMEIETLQNIIKSDELTDEPDMRNNNNHILCRICDDSRIEYCLNPCGHTFCNNCSSRLNSACFTCRSKVKSKIRMYL